MVYEMNIILHFIETHEIYLNEAVTNFLTWLISLIKNMLA